MSNNYDDYGYEDSYDNDNGSTTRKRVLIIILVIIAILLVIFLLKSCESKKKPSNTPSTTKTQFTYENALLDAGKKYYENNTDELPKSIGDCKTVSLKTLGDRGLVNPDEFVKCNDETTLVRVCMLENNKLHYVPWLVCTDKTSDTEYSESKEGTINDVVSDKSYVDFKYLPMALKKGEQKLGKVEEIWQDEIKYESYKTISTTKYYRYKDLQYKWNLVDKIYYTSKGEVSNSDDVKEYYSVSPDSKYNLHSDKATAYKWYTVTSGTKEYYMVNGAKGYSAVAPSGFPNKDVDSEISTYERYYLPTHYYMCYNNTGYVKYSTSKCGTGNSTEFPTYKNEEFDSCVSTDSPSSTDINNGKSKVVNGRCVISRNNTACSQNEKNCVKLTIYQWYKVSGGTKTYYPSMKSDAKLEKVYYTEAPVKDAIKDESTATTAYKWYKEGTKRISDYSSTAPKGYPDATKTSDSRWTEFTDWSSKKPSSASYRKIESKTKVKLQEIQGTNEDSFEEIGTEYVTLEEMFKIYTDKGYKVASLDDVTANGELKYKVKMFIRNKKEAN